VEQVRVLADHPDGGAQRRLGERPDVVAVDADRALGHVVEAGHERGERRLAGAGGADEGHHVPGPGGQRDVVEDVDAGAGVERQERRPLPLEGGDRHLGGRRVAEGDVVELDQATGSAERHRVGRVVDHPAGVEQLEHPLEGHEGEQDVDPGVREARQRPVDARDVERQRGEVPDGQRPVDHHLGAEAVHERGADGGDEAQGGEEDAAVEGAADADVADLAAERANEATSSSWRPNSLTSIAPRR
jgi:hypothetical protein